MKLAIGTAQFGAKYGLANCLGKPDFFQVENILQFGKSTNITTLDTAAAYGDSELLLGKIGVKDWQVITKIPPLNGALDNPETWVIDQVRASMSRLRIDSLYGVLLHCPQDLLSDISGGYLRALERLKAEGLVSNIGYSIYSPLILEELTKIFWPDLVQAPFNIFDQRILQSGWLDKLKQSGSKIHVRSVFLQGLLLMPISNYPNYFKPWIPLLIRWAEFTKSEGLLPIEAALSFVLNEEKIDKAVVGIDSQAQLKQLIDMNKSLAIVNLSHLACDDVALIEPFRWKIK